MTDSSQVERIETLVRQWRSAEQSGRRIPLDELCRDCPELIPFVAQKLGLNDATLNLEVTGSVASTGSPLPDQIGDFRIIQLLGQGGMGAVYLAEDVRLRRRVALKVMKPEIAADADATERFLREARAAAALDHDHILIIHHVGEAKLPDGRSLLYLAMPLLKGEPLDARIRRNEGQPLPLMEQVIIGRQVAEGLSAAHEAGLIHRDIKPANIWLESRKDGTIRAKILDFGLARSNQDVQLTHSGALLGTPAYISPEQASAQKIDGRADLFSLGCTLYVMATGKMPFSGSSLMEVLLQIATVEPAPVRERNPALPSAYSSIIAKLMAKKREDRYPTAADAAKALRMVEQSMTLPDIPMAMPVEHADTINDSPPIVVPVPKKRNRLPMMLGAVTLLAVACGIVVLKSMGPNATGTEPSIAEVTKGEDKGKAVVQQPEPKVGPKLTPIEIPFKANEAIGPGTLVTKPTPIPALVTWNIAPAASRMGYADVAWHPNGMWWATASDDGWIRIHERATGRLTRMFPKSLPYPHCLAWSPDGQYLASTNAMQVQIWCPDTGQLCIEHPRRPIEGYSPLTWFLDSRKLAFCDGNAIRLWNLTTKEVRTIPIGRALSWDLAWSPDGRWLASCGDDLSLSIHDVATGKIVQELIGTGEGRIRRVSWSADSNQLATTGSTDGILHIWDRKSGQKIHSVKLEHRADTVRWHPKENLVASAGFFEGIQLVDTSTGQFLRVIACPPCNDIAWSPDGTEILASGSYDVAGYRIYDLKSGALRQEFPSSVPPVQWSLISVGSKTGRVLTCDPDRLILWSPDMKKQLRTFPWQCPNGPAFKWSPDETSIIVAETTGPTFHILDSMTGERRTAGVGYPGGMTGISWSPDGRWISVGASSKEETRLLILDAKTLKIAHEVPDLESAPSWTAFSPDGKQLAIGTHDGRLSFVQTEGWKPGPMNGEKGPQIRFLSWSPGSKHIGSWSAAKENRVWNTTSGKLETTLPIRSDNWYGMTWTQKGDYLLTVGGNEISVWDSSTWKLARSISVNPREIMCLSVGDSSHGIAVRTTGIQWLDPDTMTLSTPLKLLNDGRFYAISPEGHIVGSPGIEDQFMYLAATKDGIETLTAAEFAKKYGWKNDPSKVILRPGMPNLP